MPPAFVDLQLGVGSLEYFLDLVLGHFFAGVSEIRALSCKVVSVFPSIPVFPPEALPPFPEEGPPLSFRYVPTQSFLF